MVSAGIFEPIAYLGGLFITLVAVALLYRSIPRVGAAALRVVVWSLASGLGVGSAFLLVVDSSGFSYGGFDALLVISAWASIPAFGIVAIAVVALRILFNRGFEALERMPLIVVAIAVFMIGAVGTFVVILRSVSGR